MATNEEVWAAIGAQAAVQIEAMTAAYTAAQLSTDALIASSARALLAASYAATRYADLAAAAWALSTSGLPSNVLGLLPPRDEQDTLIKGFATIYADTIARTAADENVATARAEDAKRRVLRLAETNTRDSGRRAYQQALTKRGVESWVRVLSASPCEGCIALRDQEGAAVPMSVRMWCHPGCKCRFVPSERAERTWGERVKADSFGYKATKSGVVFKSGLVFSSID